MSPRWAQPSKNLLVAAIVFALGVIVYVLWLTTSMAGLVGGGLQFASVLPTTRHLRTGCSRTRKKRARHLGGLAVPHLEDRPAYRW